MVPDIDKLERLKKFLAEKYLPVLVGGFIGFLFASWSYENFRFYSMKEEISQLEGRLERSKTSCDEKNSCDQAMLFAQKGFETYDDIYDVLQKATKLISVAEHELWIATDVAAFGAVSDEKLFEKYHLALAGAAADGASITKILWFSPEIEARYNDLMFNLSGDRLKKMAAKGKSIRELFPGAEDSRIVTLAWQNFWLVKDSAGKYHSLVVWFSPNPDSNSEIFGLYTADAGFAEMLIKTWKVWKNKEKITFRRSLHEFLAQIIMLVIDPYLNRIDLDK